MSSKIAILPGALFAGVSAASFWTTARAQTRPPAVNAKWKKEA